MMVLIMLEWWNVCEPCITISNLFIPGWKSFHGRTNWLPTMVDRSDIMIMGMSIMINMIMMPFCAYPHLQSTMVDRSNIMTMDNGHEHADRSAHDAFTYLTPANLQYISGPRDLNISRPQCLSNSDGRVPQKHGWHSLFLTKVTMRRYPDMIMFEEFKESIVILPGTCSCGQLVLVPPKVTRNRIWISQTSLRWTPAKKNRHEVTTKRNKSQCLKLSWLKK